MTGCKLDTHVHTNAVSACASISPEAAVACYEAHGYQGIIITEHFYQGYFDRLGDMPWAEKLHSYWAGYRRAKAAAKGLTVLPGLEYRSTEAENDYLVYGVSDAFLASEPDLCALPQREALRRFKAAGATVLQAHPARVGVGLAQADGQVRVRYTSDEIEAFLRDDPALPRMPWLEALAHIRRGEADLFRTPRLLTLCTVDCPEDIDGIEYCNGNTYWAQEEDVLQALLAAHPGYLLTSGSDFHEAAHCGRGGMLLPQTPATIEAFVAQLHDPADVVLLGS